MKWWGWGDEAESFALYDRPNLATFLTSRLGLTLDRRHPPLPLEAIELRPTRLAKGQFAIGPFRPDSTER